MTKPIYILNGPNLNRLGKREPEIYGTTTLAEIEAMCRDAAGERPLRFHQSNFEGEIVGWIHEAIDEGSGIIINPAGLSFKNRRLGVLALHQREKLAVRAAASRIFKKEIMNAGIPR